MLRTKITELFGITYPVSSAPMTLHSGDSLPPPYPLLAAWEASAASTLTALTTCMSRSDTSGRRQTTLLS